MILTKEEILVNLREKVKTPEQQYALDNCVAIYVTGSHLYGTNHENSDLDLEGVFMETPEYVLGQKNCNEVSFDTGALNTRRTNEDVDCKLYSIRKYLSLLAQNNPNKIETLFIPENMFILQSNYFKDIMDNKHIFLSKRIEHSFAGYANDQKHKMLGKKKRLLELEEFQKILQEGMTLGLTKIGQLDLLEEFTVKKYDYELDKLIVHKLKRLKKKYQYITYIKTREGTDGVSVDNRQYNFGMSIESILNDVTKELNIYGNRTKYLKEFGFDIKFCSHIFRLYQEGIDLLNTGNLELPCNNREFLLEIKQGKYSLDELLEKIEKYDPLLKEASTVSKLLYSPDYEAITNLQVRLLKKYWKEKNLF